THPPAFELECAACHHRTSSKTQPCTCWHYAPGDMHVNVGLLQSPRPGDTGAAEAGQAGGLPTHMIRKLPKRIPSPFGRPAHSRTTPAIIPASQHPVKRSQI